MTTVEETPDVTTQQPTTTERAAAGDAIIRNHALLAAGGGLIPVPGLDVAAVTGIQINMIRRLSELYGLPFEVQDVRTILSCVAATGLGKLVSYAVNSYTTLFEEFGSFSDNLTNGLVSGAITFGTGEIIQTHFEHGGTMGDLDYMDFIDYYQEKIQSGDLVPQDIMQIEQGIRSALTALK
ncbi:MAG: DUF697 domain-containing protein [Saprospiraceae bacterium]